MALYLPDAGEIKFLERAFGKSDSSAAVVVRLYVNDYTPVAGSVAADFTEMSTNSYSGVAYFSSNWVVTTIAGVASASQAEHLFEFSAGDPVVVYGCYITDDDDGTVIFAERFASPQTIELDTDTITITPVVTLSTA